MSEQLDIAELRRLVADSERDGESEFHCAGCRKLHTRCMCENIAWKSLPALLDAAEERDVLKVRLEQTHAWYADRWARLRAFLAKGSAMEKGACDIMANGHLLADQDRKSAVALATERAEAAEAKLAALLDAAEELAKIKAKPRGPRCAPCYRANGMVYKVGRFCHVCGGEDELTA